MKRSLIAISIASVFALSACSKQVTEPEPQASVAAKVDAQSGKAELGSFGVELDARNLAVKPGDDFFMYASGTWYDNFKMPADKTRFGAFTALAERSEERVKEIIENISSATELSAEENLIADFYNAYMNVERINQLGLTPIQPILDDINQISNVTDLTATFGKAWLTDTESLIGGGM